jgi:serine/threonine-protein kinase
VAETVAGAPADLPPGFVVGEYRIDRLLGRGGMGTVYAAIQPVIEKQVAIKVLGTQFSSTPELVRRFVDEARAVNRIRHENIIDIFSFGQLTDGRHYFVMELLDGATLGDLVQRGEVPGDEIGPVLLQICDALEAAHAAKIVHRDLKPENVWVTFSSRGRPTVRLLDFGIAKLLDVGDRTSTDVGVVMGTPQYMSPEQCQGRGVDHRTDIYALGVMIYRIYAGRLPIEGQTFAEIIYKQVAEVPPPPSTYAALPVGLDRLIVSCLEKDPERRPQSMRALADELAPLVTAAPAAAGAAGPSPGGSAARIGNASTMQASAAAPPIGEPPAQPAPAARSRRPVAVIGLVVAAAVVAVVGFALRERRAGNSGAPSAPVATVATSPPAPKPAIPPRASGGQATPPALPAVASVPATKTKPASDSPHHPGAHPAAAHPAPLEPPASKASSHGLATDNPFR